VSDHMDRKDFLKAAGIATAGASAVPGLLATEAFAQAPHHGTQRVWTFVAVDQAPATGHIVQPRMFMEGCGNFDPEAKTVSGGGRFFLFDNDPARPAPKPLIAFGSWRATTFVNYDTKGLQPYAVTQPAILEVLADVQGLGSGLTLEVICNVGAAGPGGQTGEEEGWTLMATPYGNFVQQSPPMGLSYLSIPGFSI
jgi:hypothetical protein